MYHDQTLSRFSLNDGSLILTIGCYNSDTGEDENVHYTFQNTINITVNGLSEERIYLLCEDGDIYDFVLTDNSLKMQVIWDCFREKSESNDYFKTYLFEFEKYQIKDERTKIVAGY